MRNAVCYRLRSGYLLLLSFLVGAGQSAADSAIQTDWSGGYAVYGPMGQWDNTFSDCNLDYGLYQPGRLSLSRREIDPSFFWYADIGGVQHIEVYDIDGDGSGEVIIQTNELGLVILCDILPPSHFVMHTMNPELGFPICFADINNDGLCDLVGGGNATAWLENTGSWSLEWPLHVIGFSSEECLDVHDIDGDGDLDVAGGIGVGFEGDAWWWRNDDGIGSTWTAVSTDSWAGPLEVCVADIDRDGDGDIYYTNAARCILHIT